LGESGEGRHAGQRFPFYDPTSHAFNYRPTPTGRAVDSWTERFYDWLAAIGMVKK
jgi:hypothetical protein